MKKVLLILSLAFGLSACGGSGSGYKSMAPATMAKVKVEAPVLSYATALKVAKSEQKKAKKVGMEWNTIRKLMKSAKKKAKAGNEKAAIKLLVTAAEHGRLGQQQAKDQVNAGPNF
ncbi:hypothetical protein BTHERMOSOX_1164 [Bathymodiolus thermophilus thioautotrophic gill symbiont]|jgi:hypothetical protein|uniref:SoxXA-binding protein n=1 Tax=Bathymodiolus thermophilus thioautotrophic gill symbiont TaxID=2360 RepID=A0A1J5TW43_9GAMM|nr:hypothetical protein [Bathymodiolus thermophilus thioautotrophic gill symbiont]AYQ56205.1 hypothetical protein MS2017_0462 [Bathymodiolus thermophilus thioautotrophic gill symbiont]OIR24412.1 hypothetical protein BGC33_10395 [Bathymodiolus thermophilus thioautotrophic gill symbiont]CAB5494714.1 hypothetical protein THERMOS_139 [Bathymodiolus thermophilus thioautotrophic gill symbiont]CAB5495454.1 hypothetical protein THERMOT_310 [Bathymodiolus thermophilus thioautotrophic gill symbiont]SHA2